MQSKPVQIDLFHIIGIMQSRRQQKGPSDYSLLTDIMQIQNPNKTDYYIAKTWS